MCGFIMTVVYRKSELKSDSEFTWFFISASRDSGCDADLLFTMLKLKPMFN